MQHRGIALGLGLVALACAKPPVRPPPQAPTIASPELDDRTTVEEADRATVEETVEAAPPPHEPPVLFDEDRRAGACVEPTRCPLRALLLPHASIYAGREHAEVIDDADEGFPGLEPMVVAATPADERTRVELACAAPDHWVSIFVEPSALASVVLEPVRLATRATRVAKSQREGLYLAAGTWVSITERKGRVVQVTVVAASSLGGSGWLASSALGTIYRPPASLPWSHPESGRRTFDWSSFVPVYDQSGGEPFAKLSGWIELRELGRRKGEQVLIAAGPDLDAASHVVGWIDADALDREEGPHEGVPGGVPGGLGKQKVVALEAGTALVLGPWRMGEVVQPTEMQCVRDCESQHPRVLTWCGTLLTLEAIAPPSSDAP